MKRIGEIRAKLAWIHTYRNLAVSAVNDRSDKMLRDSIVDMKRCIAELEKLLEECEIAEARRYFADMKTEQQESQQ
jgi:hypothetical protein